MSSNSKVVRLPVTRSAGSRDDDAVVVEEPLEIRIGSDPVSVTLRTPGDDFDLAVGFLFTEAILRSREDVESIRHWGSPNIVRVALREGVKIDLGRLKRHFYSTSSCGVCGKTSINALRVATTTLESAVSIARDVLVSLPDRLRSLQPAFDATGAIHAAASFDAGGEVVVIREDVGRHNAVDKVIGSMLMEGRKADVLVVSGRTSFELVQKCVVARIPILVAVGAPTSLAVELAQEFNVTLTGFVRDGRFNVYAGEKRIKPAS